MVEHVGHRESRGHLIIIIAVVFLALSYVAMAIRCYVRAVLLRHFWIDDWLMVFVLLAFSVFCAFQIVAATIGGAGLHYLALTAKERIVGVKYFFVGALFNICALTVFKFAIGTQLLRVCTSKLHIYAVWVIMLFSGASGTAEFFVVLFQCQSPSHYWHIGSPNRKCIDQEVLNVVLYSLLSVNAFADWCFGVMPAFVVWNLNIPRTQKFEVAGLMSFAAVGGIATVARIRCLVNLRNTYDKTWAFVPYTTASTIESGICIIAASLATFRPLWQARRASARWSVGQIASLQSAQGGHDNMSNPRESSSLTPMMMPPQPIAVAHHQEFQPPMSTMTMAGRPNWSPPPEPRQQQEDLMNSIEHIVRGPITGTHQDGHEGFKGTDVYPSQLASSQEDTHAQWGHYTDSNESFRPIGQQPTRPTGLQPLAPGRVNSIRLSRVYEQPAPNAPLVRRDVVEKFARVPFM